MEEGPEPQELFEQVERNLEEKESEAAKKRFVMRSAITASILAVCAALGSLLSGHAANEAILKQAEASDQWSFYQAKSMKTHIFEGNKDVVVAIAAEEGRSDSPQLAKVVKQFDERIAKYSKEKDDIQKDAQNIQKLSASEFEEHQRYSLGVACFQIGIVLASVAIMVSSPWLYFGSIGAGVVGVLFLINGLMLTAKI